MKSASASSALYPIIERSILGAVAKIRRLSQPNVPDLHDAARMAASDWPDSAGRSKAGRSKRGPVNADADGTRSVWARVCVFQRYGCEK